MGHGPASIFLSDLRPQSLGRHRRRNNYIKESDPRHLQLKSWKATGTENVSPKQPTNTDFVLPLLKFVKNDKRTVQNKWSGRLIYEAYVVHRCAKTSYYVSLISFLGKTGFQNPFAHLKSFYAKLKDTKIKEVTMHCIYDAAPDEIQRSGGTILLRFVYNYPSEY